MHPWNAATLQSGTSSFLRALHAGSHPCHSPQQLPPVTRVLPDAKHIPPPFPAALLCLYLLAVMVVLETLSSFIFCDTLVFYPSLLHLCFRLSLLQGVAKGWDGSKNRHCFLTLLFLYQLSGGDLVGILHLKM